MTSLQPKGQGDGLFVMARPAQWALEYGFADAGAPVLIGRKSYGETRICP